MQRTVFFPFFLLARALEQLSPFDGPSEALGLGLLGLYFDYSESILLLALLLVGGGAVGGILQKQKLTVEQLK